MASVPDPLAAGRAMTRALWTPKWTQKNRLDGLKKHLCLWHRHYGVKFPAIFATRRECREFIEQEYGYIRDRADLRSEPHCWRVPTAVRVKIVEMRK